MSDRNDLPQPSSPNFDQRVRETIQTYLGKQGDPMDRGLTLRDLIDNGIVKLKAGFNSSSISGGGAVPIDPINAPSEIDLTPPPTPSGFTVAAAITHVFIQHDAPSYTVGHGHLRTHVYGVSVAKNAALPVFTDAVELGQFSGVIWSMPSNPATTWRLWIKWETADGILSPSPAGGTNGLEAITGQDVSTLLTSLTGQIKESQLYADLGARINLIDGPETLSGSVAAKVLAETVARGTAITNEVNTRSAADTAIAQTVTALSSQVNNPTTGLPATRATLVQDYYTKTGTNSAISSATTTLNSRLNNAGGTGVTLETAYSTQASAISGLSAQYTVKTDINGYVSGFGLASTAKDAAATSTFAVRSDTFYIASPYGPGVTPSMPFIVQTTAIPANEAPGGVAIPIGVYMTDAFIKNGTITNAKIASLAVDNAKIADLSVDKLTAGSISTGEYIQSSNYLAGSAGWRINGSGSLEMNTGTFRGALAAATGTFKGELRAATGTFSGELQAVTGTFSGNISTAYGTFTGGLKVGASPAFDTSVLGAGKMTGAGALIQSDGYFAMGDSTKSIVRDSTGLSINGFTQLTQAGVFVDLLNTAPIINQADIFNYTGSNGKRSVVFINGYVYARVSSSYTYFYSITNIFVQLTFRVVGTQTRYQELQIKIPFGTNYNSKELVVPYSFTTIANDMAGVNTVQVILSYIFLLDGEGNYYSVDAAKMNLYVSGIGTRYAALI